MTLSLTAHALEQFATRYRPEATLAACEAELAEIVARAAPTKRLTLNRDAAIWLAVDDAGEPVHLVVRDRTVITVLRDSAEGRPLVDHTIDPELLDESAETRRACHDMLRADGVKVPSAKERARRETAAAILERHAGGTYYNQRSLDWARRTLAE